MIRARKATARTAVVDLGGPGLSLFGVNWPTGISQEMPPSLQGFNLLLIEEPWVTHKYKPACRDDLASYYAAVRSGSQTPNPGLPKCALGDNSWGWTASSYSSAIRQIAKAEDVRVEAFVGASFASRRLAYLGSLTTTNYIADPAPPGSYDAAQYLRDRRSAALEKIRLDGCECSSEADVVNALARAAATLRRDPVKVEGRSLPVAADDIGAAAIALAYQDPATIKAGWEAIEDPVNGARLIGRLSDSAWGRFGTNDLSQSWLAYLGEVCRSMQNWRTATTASSSDPIQTFMQARHAPCQYVDKLAPQIPSVSSEISVCVVHGKQDGVITQSMIAPWKSMPRAQVISSASKQHGDLEALQQCEKEK